MPKIYISPSLRSDVPCKHGDSEHDHCCLYADILAQYLESSGIGFMMSTASSPADAVRESNLYHPDIHYACHTNSFNEATRYSVMLTFKADVSAPAYACAGQIKKHRLLIYPRPVYISRNRQIYEITHTQSPCIYDEIVFHDNAEDAQLFHDNIKRFAELTAAGFCGFFGLPLISPGEIKTNRTPLDIKAMYDKASAELNLLKEKYIQLKTSLPEPSEG